MSAFPESGHSDHQNLEKMRDRFRPQADARGSLGEPVYDLVWQVTGHSTCELPGRVM